MTKMMMMMTMMMMVTIMIIMIRYEDVSHVFSSKAGAEAAGLQTVIVEGEVVETIAPGDIDTENYSPSLGSASQALTVSNTSLL